MTESLSETQNHVCRLLKIGIRDPGKVASMPESELDLLIRLARRVRLHGRLSVNMKAVGIFEGLPKAARDQLESAEIMAAARERIALWELDRIAWALGADNDVPLICVKGCAYILLNLPNRHGRIFADVDLLVPEGKLNYVERKLNTCGWTTRPITAYDDHYYRKWTHELPPLVHKERDVEIDLHHNILPRTARLRPDGDAIVNASRTIDKSRFLLPSNEDLVLHAATHLMFDSDIEDKLRDLVDIDDMLREFGSADREFWCRLLNRAQMMDLCRPLFYSLRFAKRILDCPVPGAVIDQIDRWGPPMPVRQLMDKLVPAAILPPHPDYRHWLNDASRFFLYVRSHWIRMPPWLLVFHLFYKAVGVRFSDRKKY